MKNANMGITIPLLRKYAAWIILNPLGRGLFGLFVHGRNLIRDGNVIILDLASWHETLQEGPFGKYAVDSYWYTV